MLVPNRLRHIRCAAWPLHTARALALESILALKAPGHPDASDVALLIEAKVTVLLAFTLRTGYWEDSSTLSASSV